VSSHINIKSVRDIQIAGKAIFLRLDFNVPIENGVVTDDSRIVEALPTIKYCMEKNARVVIGSHLGRPDGKANPKYSMELCGGTHVRSTGEIERFKIISESSVAAGVRRVEAITGILVDKYNEEQNKKLAAAENVLRDKIELMKAKAMNLYSGIEGKSLKDLEKEIDLKAPLQQQEDALSKLIDNLTGVIAQNVKAGLLKKVTGLNGVNLIAEKIELGNADAIKNISFELKNQLENLVCVIGATIDGKAYLSVIISENLVKDKNFSASNMIREAAKEIQGGGGGQPFYATAGGKNPEGIPAALEKIRSLLK